MEILASIGKTASLALQREPLAADRRQKWLELQTTAAKALLEAAPERAEDWRETLELLAANWLREAQFTYQWDTSTALGPRMQRDMYGNFFFWEQQQQRMRANVPAAISSMRPVSRACFAPIGSPLLIMSSASGTPTRRGRRCVPPAPGSRPSFTSGKPNLASAVPML